MKPIGKNLIIIEIEEDITDSESEESDKWCIIQIEKT